MPVDGRVLRPDRPAARRIAHWPLLHPLLNFLVPLQRGVTNEPISRPVRFADAARGPLTWIERLRCEIARSCTIQKSLPIRHADSPVGIIHAAQPIRPEAINLEPNARGRSTAGTDGHYPVCPQERHRTARRNPEFALPNHE